MLAPLKQEQAEPGDLFVTLPSLHIILIFHSPEQDVDELESFLINFFVFRARSRPVVPDLNLRSEPPGDFAPPYRLG